MSELATRVLNGIRLVVGGQSVGLHEPVFSGNERAYIAECVDSTFVSSVGTFVERFENQLARITGAQNAVAVVNGTSALHAALILAGVGPGDEVIVPAFSFVATANAVTYCGAVPHFVDIEEESLGMSPQALRHRLKEIAIRNGDFTMNRETGRRISAIVPVHVFGHPCNIYELLDIALDFGIAVVEDSAESLGSLTADRHIGTFGRLGILSFNGNKTVTTGGGGAILTEDIELANLARHITTTAKKPHAWRFDHDRVGFNYRMPNLNAALGCAQLEQLPSIVDSQRRLYERYSQIFHAVENVRMLKEPPGCRSNYWLQSLVLDASVADERDNILDVLNAAGVGARPPWEPLSRLRPFRSSPRGPLSSTLAMAARIINIPSSPGLA